MTRHNEALGFLDSVRSGIGTAVVALVVALGAVALPAFAQSNDKQRRDPEVKKDGKDASQAEGKRTPAKRPPARRPSPKTADKNLQDAKGKSNQEEPPDEQRKPVEIDPELQKKIDDLLKKSAERDEKREQPATRQPPPRTRPATRPDDKADRDQPADREDGVPINVRGRGGANGNQQPVLDDIDNIPPEERVYTFSIDRGTYTQLLDGVSLQTGLGIVGQAPDGELTFNAAEPMSFDEMLRRVRVLLFKYRNKSGVHEPYWFKHDEENGYLEVIRLSDISPRDIKQNRMFRTREEFEAAAVHEDELALVIYTPRAGSVADLTVVRDYLPDYVRIAPLEKKNSVTIFAKVSDIEKYFQLEGFFLGGELSDPRTLKKIEVKHIPPSEALDLLGSMMELDATTPGQPTPRTPRRGGQPDVLEGMAPPPVAIIPFDDQGILLIRAMADKIAEIEYLLPFIDVLPATDPTDPVLIPVRHADPQELISVIQQFLASSSAGTSRQRSTRRAGKGSVPATAVAATVEGQDITMVPLAAQKAIAVVGPEDMIERVRKLVAMLDVQSEVGPLRIELQYIDASELANTINPILAINSPRVRGKADAGPATVIPEPTGAAVWVSGPKSVVEEIKSMIATLDTPGDPTELHVVTLRNQLPSFVASMLQQLDISQATSSQSVTTSKGRRATRNRRTSTPTVGLKFTPDDAKGKLYVICSAAEWDVYSKYIDQLEHQGAGPLLTEVPVVNITPDEAIELIRSLLYNNQPGGVVMSAKDDGILIRGASDADLADIREILDVVDVKVSTVRKSFELRHVSPDEMIALLQSLVGSSSSAGQPLGRRVPRRPTKDGDAVSSTVQGGLDINTIGSLIVVTTTPEKMAEVEAIVQEFDVEQRATELRVFDFPPGADVENIAQTLSAVLGGNSVGRSVRRGKVAVPADGAAPQFIPQPAAHKILVVSEPSRYAEIEELVSVLRSSVGIEERITEYITVQNVDPEELIETIKPLLKAKVSWLVESGEIEEAIAGAAEQPRRPQVRTSSSDDPFTLLPDARNSRIVIVAAKPVIAEAKILIADFDTPIDDDPVFELVPLQYAEAGDMVTAVSQLMAQPGKPAIGTQTPAPRRPRGRRARAERAAAESPASAASSGDFTIAAAPGGGAVILRGPREEVELAKEYIAQLDNGDTIAPEFKVYTIEYADLDQLAELIFNAFDKSAKANRAAPGRGAARAAGSRGGGKESGSEDSFLGGGFDFSTTKSYMGEDLMIKTESIASTMIVVANSAKIAQIDKIVEQFDEPDGVFGKETTAMPVMTYRLKNKDSMDAAWDLEGILGLMWEPQDQLPYVDYSTALDDVLIIKYPYEDRFPDIEDLIAEYVDVVSETEIREATKVFQVPSGLTPEEMADWLKSNYPDLNINLIPLGEPEEDPDYGIQRVQPRNHRTSGCVLPGSFSQTTAQLLTAAMTLQREDEPDEDQQWESGDVQDDPNVAAALEALQSMQEGGDPDAQSSSESDKSSKSLPSASSLPEEVRNKPVNIFYDPRAGMFKVQGPQGIIDLFDKAIEDFAEELKENARPETRVYRVTHIDVNKAKEIVEEMFGVSKAELARIAAAQRAQQQAAARARAQQQRAQAGQKGQPAGRGGDDQQQQQQQQQQIQVPQARASNLKVLANPADRTLIISANAGDFPPILELLATIDQPQPFKRIMKTFQLVQLDAEEVAATLSTMLGLSETGARGRARGAAEAAAGPLLPESLLDETDVGLLEVTPDDIDIKANPVNNTLLVMAPQAALDYIERLINEMESYEGPARSIEHFELAYAEVGEVVNYLNNHFQGQPAQGQGRRGAARGAAGGRGGLARAIAPIFVAYPPQNLLTVEGTEEQITQIHDLVAMLDKPADDEKFVPVRVKVDAADLADQLTQLYTAAAPGRAPRGGRGQPGTQQGPQFHGVEGSNLLYVAAPASVMEDIRERITELEEELVKVKKPRMIRLEYAKASEIADVLMNVYGEGGSRRGRRGAAPGGLRVDANDEARLLFVTSDDQTFGEIKELVETELDKPGDMPFGFKVFILQHADAKATYDLLTKLMTDYLRSVAGGRGAIEPFSVQVDEKNNALVVLGSPTVFKFVEENLPFIDNPANARSVPTYFMIALKNADAQEVANNIKQLFGTGRRGRTDEDAPKVEANRTSNTLLIYGTNEQVEEIKKEIINPLEDYSPPSLVNETITLQFAKAETVAESISLIFEDRNRALREYRGSNVPPLERTVVVTPDPITNQLIVQASESNMELIKARVAALDREDVAVGSATTMQVYPIKYADPNAVANILREWARSRSSTSGRNRNVATRDQVSAYAEPSTQTVVVTASEENHLIVQEMLESLDGEVASARQRKQSVLRLTQASAEDVVNQLTQFYQRQQRRRGDSGPTFIADLKTNSIIVSANEQEFEEVQKLLEDIDVKATADMERQIRSFTMRYANAWSVQQAVNQLFMTRGRPNPRDQVTAVPEWGSNGVIVAASKENMKKVEELINQLDQAGDTQQQVEVIPIEHGDAFEVSQALDQIFVRTQPRSMGGQPPAITITALTQSNSIMVKAATKDIDEIKETLVEMDREDTSGGTKLIALQHMRVGDLVPMLEQMYGDAPRGGRGRGAAQMQPIFSANEATNTLIVRAAASDYKEIESFVQQMDTSDNEQAENYRIVAVAPSVNVQDLAEKVQDAINETADQTASRGGSPRGRRTGGNRILVQADPRSSTLILSGSPSLFDPAEDMIKLLEGMGPAGGRATRIVPIENLSPEAVEQLIDRLREEGSGSSSGSRRSSSRGRRR